MTVIAMTAAIALAACAGDNQASQAPRGLASTSQLQQDREQRGKWTYRAPGVDVSKYRRFLFDAVAVYTGPEAHFGSIALADRDRLAAIVGEEFIKTVGEKYPVTASIGPDVLRVRLTLLGVDETVGGLATATRILPVGIAVNAVKGAGGGSGSFTGSIELAFEAFDTQSGELVAAAIRQATPAVYDIEATTSTSNTVRSSARVLAVALNEAIERAQRK